jgi:hypothetical protein
LDSLIKRAANIVRNVEFGKSLDQGSSTRSYSTPPPRSSTNTSSSASKTTRGEPRSFTKITDSEQSIWTRTTVVIGVAR